MPTAAERTGAQFTVVGSSVLALTRHAQSRGVDPTPVLRTVGLSAERLEDPDERVPQPVYNRAFHLFAEACHDPDFGLHFAESGDIDGFHVVGHLARRSRTLGEAFERVARYSRIVHDAGRVEVELSDAGLVVFPGCRGLLHEFPRQVAEYSAASVIVVARALTEKRLLPLDVGFRHPAPEATTEHRRILGCEPRFGRPETVVVFDRSVASETIAGAEPGLVSLLELLASGLLEKLGEADDLMARVEQLVARRLEDGVPSLDDVARQLGVGKRVLQRRLRQSETTFQGLVESVRQRLAERYLENPAVSLHEIAFLLGYTDPSNFHRAFRRWFGVTPAEARARGRLGRA